MVEGTIVAWLKKAGEKISRGQPLVEIETDKTTMQIEAPVDGVLLAVLYREGDTVPVATTIAFIGAPDEDISTFREDHDAEDATPAASLKEEPRNGPFSAKTSSTSGVVPSVLYATPRARKTAEEQHIDLRDLHGSGPDSLIIERDVVRAASSVSAPKRQGTRVPAAAVGVLVPLSSMRKTIARRMKESLAAAAQASHEIDIDCTEMIRLKDDLKQWEIEITYTDILVKVLGVALRRHPLMNSAWTDEGILMREEVSVGVAVALEDGLIVPVIRNADTLSLASIHAQTRELIAKAREGILRAEDLEGAGFTVTNLGMYGIDRFTAIIDQPQTGILAVGRIVQKPVAIENTIEIRPQMTLTLSYDHRVIDGAPAARFLQTVRQLLENPCLMM